MQKFWWQITDDSINIDSPITTRSSPEQLKEHGKLVRFSTNDLRTLSNESCYFDQSVDKLGSERQVYWSCDSEMWAFDIFEIITHANFIKIENGGWGNTFLSCSIVWIFLFCAFLSPSFSFILCLFPICAPFLQHQPVRVYRLWKHLSKNLTSSPIWFPEVETFNLLVYISFNLEWSKYEFWHRCNVDLTEYSWLLGCLKFLLKGTWLSFWVRPLHKNQLFTSGEIHGSNNTKMGSWSAFSRLNDITQKEQWSSVYFW